MQKEKILGIYILRESEDYIDDYVLYFLKALKHVMGEILVIYPDSLPMKEISKLLEYTDNHYCYNNQSFMAEALSVLKEDKQLDKYLKVVWCDDSFYGPIFSIEDMLVKMEIHTEDFWGITYLFERTNESGEILPEMLETYFICINRSIIISEHLQSLLGKTTCRDWLEELVSSLNSKQFSWTSYVNADEWKAEVAYKNIVPSQLLTLELVIQHKYPVIPKTVFEINDLLRSSGENAANVMLYLKKHTKYPIDFIWQNMIHTKNVQDIRDIFHLEYVLSSDKTIEYKEQFLGKRIAIVIHLYFAELVEFCFQYIRQIPENIFVVICSSEEVTLKLINENILFYQRTNFKVIKKDNVGRDVSTLLVTCRNIFLEYDYVCFLHDKKSGQMNTVTEGRSFLYNMWENMLKSDAYIWNIIDCFENNPLLGLIVPPEPYHGNYLKILGNAWTINYENTRELAERLQLNCKLSKEKTCFTLGTVFWCRTKAMRKLFEYEFQYEDFPEEPMPNDGTISHAIERIFSYVAQSEGYYTSVAMNNEYAALRINGIQNELIEALNVLRQESISPVVNMNDVRGLYKKNQVLREFCSKYTYLYIFGAGEYGKQCAKALQYHGVVIDGFVVSNGLHVKTEVMGHFVYQLTEVSKPKEECGIILALAKRHHEKIRGELVNEGFYHIHNLI